MLIVFMPKQMSPKSFRSNHAFLREMLLCLEKVRWFWDISRGLKWFPWEGSGGNARKASGKTIADPIVWGNAYCFHAKADEPQII